MLGVRGALAVLVAALIVLSNAERHQTQAGGHSGLLPDVSKDGGNSFVRQVRDTKHHSWIPYLISRRYDVPSSYNAKADFWPILTPVELRHYYDGLPKRNFDEIDRSGLDNFVKKRNFDEIDQTSMPFPYATKRYWLPPNHVGRSGDDDTEGKLRDDHLRRNSFAFDPIDLSAFPIGQNDIP